jgi:hypothetical protein
MAAERKKLRRRKDSVMTGAEEGSDKLEVGEEVEQVETETEEKEEGDGKEVVIVVKEDLSQLAVLGRSVGEVFWSGVEGARRGVWGLAGWK